MQDKSNGCMEMLEITISVLLLDRLVSLFRMRRKSQNATYRYNYLVVAA